MIKNLITKRINYKYEENTYLKKVVSKLKTELDFFTGVRIGNDSKPIDIRNKRIIKKEIRKIKNILKLRKLNAY